MQEAIVGGAAIIYAIGFALLPQLAGERDLKSFRRTYAIVGAGIVCLLAILLYAI